VKKPGNPQWVRITALSIHTTAWSSKVHGVALENVQLGDQASHSLVVSMTRRIAASRSLEISDIRHLGGHLSHPLTGATGRAEVGVTARRLKFHTIEAARPSAVEDAIHPANPFHQTIPDRVCFLPGLPSGNDPVMAGIRLVLGVPGHIDRPYKSANALTPFGTVVLKEFNQVLGEIDRVTALANEESAEDARAKTAMWESLGTDLMGILKRRQDLYLNSYRRTDGNTTWEWAFPVKASPAEPEEGEQEKKVDKRYVWVREVPEEVERLGGAQRTWVAEGLRDVFKFRGIEYGNWQSLDSAKAHTQAAGDALADLADLLGIGEASRTA
jgi:hypothetical protein